MNLDIKKVFESAKFCLMSKLHYLVLDRDGVINKLIPFESELVSPRSINQLFLEEGVIEFMSAVTILNIPIIVVTNQPDVSRGLVAIEDVEKLHGVLKCKFPIISEIYICPHSDSDNCVCRKPSPYLIRKGMRTHSFDSSETLVVGDTWVDIEAGRSAGCETALIKRPYSWLPRGKVTPPNNLSPNYEVNSILELMGLFQGHFQM
jgi:D-glycero-D-manno-heptose 1,7-bisphosphate phosphatase